MKESREQRFANADRMKLLRTTMGLSQVKLISILNIKKLKQPYYSHAEKGEYPLPKGVLKKTETLFTYWVEAKTNEYKSEIRKLQNIVLQRTT